MHRHHRAGPPLAALTAALCVVAARAQDEAARRVPLLLAPSSDSTGACVGAPPAAGVTNALDLALAGPGAVDAFLLAPTSCWFNASRIEADLVVPPGAPTNLQAMAFVKDWDYLWYQRLLPGYLQPGASNRLVVSCAPGDTEWRPRGHHANWNARALLAPKQVGLRVFGDGPSPITCRIERVEAVLGPVASAPPAIQDVVANASRVPCYGRFEVRFALPDRYANPFDPAEVEAGADIATPDGRTVSVDAFFTQDYYRQVQPTGEDLVPQGAPHWMLRYAPSVPGPHRYTLRARDARGAVTWGPGTFLATRAALPGFVRVNRDDPRFFRFDNGACFFPIGHNVRSPTDARLDRQFPWAQRWAEGSAAYARYFRDMHANGETLAEIWQAPWSLGLEWSAKWAGYHGVGQYNLAHAWELDQVVAEAERNGIYLNMVIHNHGKFGQLEDAEWGDNPFNRALGGHLDKPEEYFTDVRALASFRNLMRYNIARWGYSTRLFAWELWSELNLTGSQRNFHQRPEVTEWHRLMGRAVKDMDPYDHLVSTHVAIDYTYQNTNIVALPEIDVSAVDAYYFGNDMYHLVRLMRQTAAFNGAFGKPVLVTEFGGSSYAQSLDRLKSSLHAGLWGSVAIPLGSTPLFWWWGLVEEENLYGEYRALSRFMKGEQRGGTDLVARMGSVEGTGGVEVEAHALAGPTRALGWISRPEAFGDAGPGARPAVTNATLHLDGLTNGQFRAEFWDTTAGTVANTIVINHAAGRLSVPIPPFARDIAFKLKLDSTARAPDTRRP